MPRLVSNKRSKPIVTKQPIIIGVDGLEHDQTTYWIVAFTKAMDRAVSIATNGSIHPIYLEMFEMINKHDVYNLHDSIYISFLGHNLDTFFDSFPKTKILYAITLPFMYAHRKLDKYRHMAELRSCAGRAKVVIPTTEGLYEGLPYDKVIAPNDIEGWKKFILELEKS